LFVAVVVVANLLSQCSSTAKLTAVVGPEGLDQTRPFKIPLGGGLSLQTFSYQKNLSCHVDHVLPRVLDQLASTAQELKFELNTMGIASGL
jgi:hypothetical protein